MNFQISLGHIHLLQFIKEGCFPYRGIRQCCCLLSKKKEVISDLVYSQSSKTLLHGTQNQFCVCVNSALTSDCVYTGYGH